MGGLGGWLGWVWEDGGEQLLLMQETGATGVQICKTCSVIQCNYILAEGVMVVTVHSLETKCVFIEV